ncbi:hypothetical protein BKA81DRAFT_362880 [Phyllosticta paracitricarpa]|uniref:Secreted protein n=1 Tax=Phyllosticta paracitricarpa TaxID=2016321 RepID=A0ABR1N4X9_9PEZI
MLCLYGLVVLAAGVATAAAAFCPIRHMHDRKDDRRAERLVYEYEYARPQPPEKVTIHIPTHSAIAWGRTAAIMPQEPSTSNLRACRSSLPSRHIDEAVTSSKLRVRTKNKETRIVIETMRSVALHCTAHVEPARRREEGDKAVAWQGVSGTHHDAGRDWGVRGSVAEDMRWICT